MKLSAVVKNYRRKNGITASEFAERCGLTKGYISQLENETVQKNTGRVSKPTITTLKKLANGMGITLHQLMEEMDDQEVGMEKSNLSIDEGSFKRVPVYSSISCGTGAWIDEAPETYVGIPDTMLSRGSVRYFSNPAEGDSMEPRIHAGDFVVFEQTPNIESGQIGAFSLNGAYYCKRFRKTPDGSLWLFSENSAYDPIHINVDDDFRVLGKYKLRITKD